MTYIGGFMKEKIRKLGAIVAGATILASSVAFAGGLMYQNTELVNAEGEPLTKIVVGSNAMASDGVAASLISNAIVNEAYKSETLTAQFVGDFVCAQNGNATCDIEEDSETVTLRVTVPGASENGADHFITAIGDYVDKELENRYTSETDSDEAYTVYDGLEDMDANPFQNFVGGVMTDSSELDEAAMYKISLGEAIIVDSKSDIETIEKQDFWAKGNNHWDEGEQELFGELNFLSYRALFDATGDNGLQLCADDDVDFSACSDMDQLQSHGVKISFLGEDWVISDIENVKDGFVDSTAIEENEIYAVDGATIKLAKESVSGIINVGEIMEAPSGYKVRLDDISRETGATNEHPAIITVLDANDIEVCREQIKPGETKDDLCDVKTDVRLHVYQTAPGLNFIAKWAEMAIFKDEIELESGNEFLDDSNTEWQVTLGWSNEDLSKDDPEYLREIVLYNADLDEMDEMGSGDSIVATDVEGYERYELTYNGLNSEDVEYDELSFEIKEDKGISSVEQPTAGECNIEDADYVEITTGEEFRYDNKKGDTMMYVFNADFSNCTELNTGNPIFVMESENGKYGYDVTGNFSVDYRHAGSQGYVSFYPATNEFWLVENAGKYMNSDIVDAMGLMLSGSDLESINTGDEDKALYLVGDEDVADVTDGDIWTSEIVFDENGYTDGDEYEEGFLSMRGTEFKSGSESAYEFKVPNKVMKTSWDFIPLMDTDSAESGSIYVLHEGEETAVGTSGIKVKVLSIDQSLTPCTMGTGAGEAPLCTLDMSDIEAVIMPNNAPEVEVVVPYKIKGNLVYLDSDNVALDYGVIITVGGDAVNTVTKEAMEGGTIDFDAENVVVKQVGNKIVVAGYSAANTMEAAQQFISELV